MVLWLALLVAYRGVMGIVFTHADVPETGGASSAGAAQEGIFVALAEAYAAQFAVVYLNLTPATPAQREQELAAFVPGGVAAANPNLGWNGTSQMSLLSEHVADIAVRDRQHSVVTVLATVNGQLMELGVPVIASRGGVLIAGEPAWLPWPQQVSPLPEPGGGSDPGRAKRAGKRAADLLPAYGDSAALSRFAARGASLTGLGGAVAIDTIASLHVPPGGPKRQITVTAIWQVPSQGPAGIAKIAMTYRVSVLALQSGKWYVNEISASTEAVRAK